LVSETTDSGQIGPNCPHRKNLDSHGSHFHVLKSSILFCPHTKGSTCLSTLPHNFFFLKKRTLWARCIVQQDCTCVPRKSCAVHASCVFCLCSCRWTPESMLLLLNLDPLHTAVLWRCQPDPSLRVCKFLLTQRRDNYAWKNTKAQKSSYCI
jgi:hypothetical protein